MSDSDDLEAHLTEKIEHGARPASSDGHARREQLTPRRETAGRARARNRFETRPARESFYTETPHAIDETIHAIDAAP